MKKNIIKRIYKIIRLKETKFLEEVALFRRRINLAYDGNNSARKFVLQNKDSIKNIAEHCQIRYIFSYADRLTGTQISNIDILDNILMLDERLLPRETIIDKLYELEGKLLLIKRNKINNYKNPFFYIQKLLNLPFALLFFILGEKHKDSFEMYKTGVFGQIIRFLEIVAAIYTVYTIFK